MKRIKTTMTILSMVIITLLIGANSNVQATQPNNIKSIKTTATGSLITYDDNTGYYIDFNEVDNNVVEFINSKQNKFNIDNNKVTVTNILYESTNNFYLSEGEIGVEFSDGSWISANLLTNEYTFQPYELGDWSFDFDNVQDLENCIKTYLLIKNNGSY